MGDKNSAFQKFYASELKMPIRPKLRLHYAAAKWKK